MAKKVSSAELLRGLNNEAAIQAEAEKRGFSKKQVKNILEGYRKLGSNSIELSEDGKTFKTITDSGIAGASTKDTGNRKGFDLKGDLLIGNDVNKFAGFLSNLAKDYKEKQSDLEKAKTSSKIAEISPDKIKTKINAPFNAADLVKKREASNQVKKGGGNPPVALKKETETERILRIQKENNLEGKLAAFDARYNSAKKNVYSSVNVDDSQEELTRKTNVFSGIVHNAVHPLRPQDLIFGEKFAKQTQPSDYLGSAVVKDAYQRYLLAGNPEITDPKEAYSFWKSLKDNGWQFNTSNYTPTISTKDVFKTQDKFDFSNYKKIPGKSDTVISQKRLPINRDGGKIGDKNTDGILLATLTQHLPVRVKSPLPNNTTSSTPQVNDIGQAPVKHFGTGIRKPQGYDYKHGRPAPGSITRKPSRFSGGGILSGQINIQPPVNKTLMGPNKLSLRPPGYDMWKKYQTDQFSNAYENWMSTGELLQKKLEASGVKDLSKNAEYQNYLNEYSKIPKFFPSTRNYKSGGKIKSGLPKLALGDNGQTTDPNKKPLFSEADLMQGATKIDLASNPESPILFNDKPFEKVASAKPFQLNLGLSKKMEAPITINKLVSDNPPVANTINVGSGKGKQARSVVNKDKTDRTIVNGTPGDNQFNSDGTLGEKLLDYGKYAAPWLAQIGAKKAKNDLDVAAKPGKFTPAAIMRLPIQSMQKPNFGKQASETKGSDIYSQFAGDKLEVLNQQQQEAKFNEANQNFINQQRMADAQLVNQGNQFNAQGKNHMEMFNAQKLMNIGFAKSQLSNDTFRDAIKANLHMAYNDTANNAYLKGDRLNEWASNTLKYSDDAAARSAAEEYMRTGKLPKGFKGSNAKWVQPQTI